jgi:hypothetical protein
MSGLEFMPPQRDHGTGNLHLGNALMPGNQPGAVGNILLSQGAGATPNMLIKWRHGYHLNVQKRVFDRLGRQNKLGQALETLKLQEKHYQVWLEAVSQGASFNKLAKDKNKVYGLTYGEKIENGI